MCDGLCEVNAGRGPSFVTEKLHFTYFSCETNLAKESSHASWCCSIAGRVHSHSLRQRVYIRQFVMKRYSYCSSCFNPSQPPVEQHRRPQQLHHKLWTNFRECMLTCRPFITGPCFNRTPISVTGKPILVLPSVSETVATNRTGSRIFDLLYASVIQVRGEKNLSGDKNRRTYFLTPSELSHKSLENM